MCDRKATGIGMIGAGFIGQMHALSFATARYCRYVPAVSARLVVLAETNEAVAADVAKRYGWETVTTDWRDAATHPEVQLFINAGPNDQHAAPNIAAAKAGKHIFSEKPLARTADEAFGIWQAAAAAGVMHMCAFMHRFIPSLRMARQMIAAGELGQIRNFRSNFLLDMVNPVGSLNWRFSKAAAGGGAVGDLGSHHIDQARYLVGEVRRVVAMTRSYSRDASGRTVDVNDDFAGAVAELDNGAMAVFEQNRTPPSHALTGRIEVDGTKGSLRFDMERLNELELREPGRGPRTVYVATGAHPFGDFWLPVGIQGAHPAGWRDCFAYQAHHMLACLAKGVDLGPDAATFEDGYRVAEVVDAIQAAAATGNTQEITYRQLG